MKLRTLILTEIKYSIRKVAIVQIQVFLQYFPTDWPDPQKFTTNRNIGPSPEFQPVGRGEILQDVSEKHQKEN
jgi:hypothetical protein